MEGAGSGRAWRVVVLFCALYAISAVDRLILALLAPAVKAAYHLDNARIGALIGLTFAALYALAGLPIARAVDLRRRKPLVVFGVVVWSCATAGSAFAPHYTALLACRAGVAVGEAVLTPAALSMIGDLFPSGDRARPTALFVSTGAIAGMAASALGGGILAVAQTLSKAAGLAPWRLTLVVLGGLGLLAAAAFGLLTQEPPRLRQEPPLATPVSTPPVPWRLYGLLFAAVSVSVMLTYSLVAWMPTILIDRFALQAPAAGFFVGGVGAASGLVGMAATPWAMERRGRDIGADTMLFTGLVLLAIASAGLAMMAMAATSTTMALALALMFGSLSSFTLLPSLLVQKLGPAVMRGRLIAVYLLMANLLGLGVGPVLTGALSDHLFPGPNGLVHALLALGGADLVLALLLVAAALGHLAQGRGPHEARTSSRRSAPVNRPSRRHRSPVRPR